jgi:hypothetical protein
MMIRWWVRDRVDADIATSRICCFIGSSSLWPARLFQSGGWCNWRNARHYRYRRSDKAIVPDRYQ